MEYAQDLVHFFIQIIFSCKWNAKDKLIKSVGILLLPGSHTIYKRVGGGFNVCFRHFHFIAEIIIAWSVVLSKYTFISLLRMNKIEKNAQKVELNHSDANRLQVWSLHPGPPRFIRALAKTVSVVYIEIKSPAE